MTYPVNLCSRPIERSPTRNRTMGTDAVMRHLASRTNFDHSPCCRDGLHPPT